MAGKSLLLIEPGEEDYVDEIRGLFNGETPYISTKAIVHLHDLSTACKQGGITKVISTNTTVLSKLLYKLGNVNSEPKLSEYAGSFFSDDGIDYVFIPPMRQLRTVSYGKFIAQHFISKLTNPSEWVEPAKFKWEILNERNADRYLDLFSSARFIAVDIETYRTNLAIRCIGYCAVHVDAVTGHISTTSVYC